MATKVVTDSTCDLPRSLAEELGLTVVPLTVRFGDETYRDGIDMSADEFYARLSRSPALPSTSQPSPAAFAQVYHDLLSQGHEVLSVHISAKLSGTCTSALVARQEVGGEGRIEVLDSQQASLGLGLIAVEAARQAQAGANLAGVVKFTQEAIPQVETVALLDTLEYLVKGGRIGKAQALLGSLLNIKPIIQIKDGEVHPRERVRTRARAVESLVAFVQGFSRIESLALAYSTTPQEAEALARRLEPFCPRERAIITQIGPAIGTHAGPGALGVAVRGTRA